MYIQAINLQKSYNKRKIVKGIHLEIGQGEILAVIGPNGAGKSTTLEILIGLRKADAGEINYWLDAYKEKIGVQLQAAPFFVGLNAFENLKLFAAFYKKKLTDCQVNDMLKICGLYDVRKVDASKLSGGQQKRLAISIALIHNPDLIFLDEPTAALDPRARQEIHHLIKQLHKQNKTVVFTSHDMDEVDKLATRVMMIDEGEIIAQGNPSALCREHHVSNLEQLYLKLAIGGERNVSSNF
ncbi:ABC transporter ATP-binding protein [Lysinibacillus sp. KU-BSD001]|uniref:ABC transporter ATP-binding protein n=1 Tax=Lysinibacillus sp. KU-BSD001 TaxID=3141328 RepID=UPI0036F00899